MDEYEKTIEGASRILDKVERKRNLKRVYPNKDPTIESDKQYVDVEDDFDYQFQRVYLRTNRIFLSFAARCRIIELRYGKYRGFEEGCEEELKRHEDGKGQGWGIFRGCGG